VPQSAGSGSNLQLIVILELDSITMTVVVNNILVVSEEDGIYKKI
jgi:hypothetical protein